MVRKILILIVFGLLYQIGHSQNGGYKYEVSKKVFDAIVSAYGSNRDAPVFEILQKNSPGPKQILMYYPGTQPKVIMDEDVYDLCAGMGFDSLNALAALLGHELAHHYEKHNWCSSFAFLLDDKSELKLKLSKIAKETKSANEAEADDVGGFYGYVAGFSTYDITAKLLDKIYAYYKLPNSIKGYPTKDERKQIAATSLKKLTEYKAVFDAGETMYCLKEYSASAACFEYLADKFPSREMFGNTGAVKLMSAMEFIDGESMPFYLPMEIDGGTRLKNHAVRGLGANKEDDELHKKELLEDALKYFDKAINIDPTYMNAQINKGCAYILLDDQEGAIGIFNTLGRMNKDKVNQYDLSKAYSIRAIAYFKKGEKDTAQKDFEMAQKLSSISRNTYNLAVNKELNKGVIDVLADFVASYFDEEKTSEYGKEKAINPALEKIGSESANLLNVVKMVELSEPSNKFIKVSFTPHDTYKSLKIKGEKAYSILITEDSYNGKTSQGIGKGDNAKKIKLQYGEPTYMIDELKGKYLVYKKSRIVFLLNRNDRLVKWFTCYY